MVEQKFSLELTKNGIQQVIYAKEGERKARKLKITLTVKGEVIPLTDYAITAYFDDGTQLPVTPAENPVTFEIPAGLCTEPGERIVELKFTRNWETAPGNNESSEVYSPQFRVIVEQTIGATAEGGAIGDPTQFEKLLASDTEVQSPAVSAMVPLVESDATKLIAASYFGTASDVSDLDTRLETAEGDIDDIEEDISDITGDISDINTALDSKANSSDVTSALALKANTSDVTSALALKADASDVTTALSDKVDKVSGKGLSTNDYDATEKANVAANTLARHTHSNKTVLDKFGESSGTPTYDGQPIGGGGGTITDVQDEQGNSLVSEGIATIPSEVVEIIRSYRLAYTPSEIETMFRTKELKISGKTVVDIYSYGTGVSLNTQIYFIDRDDGEEYLYYNEYSNNGTAISTRNKVGRWSEANYTSTEKTKLNGIATGAEVNVLEKVKDSNGNELPITDKGVQLPAIPAAQIQSDWEQSDNTAKDYIKNKPSIPAAQVQADWNESDNTKADYIKNKPDLSIYAQSSSLATVATSGSYNDLSNTPTIPTAGTIAQGDTGYATGGDVYTELQSIPSMPSGTNAGDILVWDGDEWVTKPSWRTVYQPVEWIRSSGICYFNTGYYPQTNDVFTIDYQLDSWASSSSHPQFALFGTQNGGSGTRPQVLVFGENGIIRFACQAFYDTSIAFDTNRHTIVLDSKNGEFKYDGNTLVTFPDVLQTPSYEMRILSSNSGGNTPSQNNCLQGFFYGHKVENDGTIIKNYIPVYNIYSGEVGIFDTANLVFISKSGSGTLTHGNDIN